MTITADEIDARIKQWKVRGTGRVAAACRVMRGGVPVANAEVKFVPEAFWVPGCRPAQARPTPTATCSSSQPSQSGEKGMSPGFYRVEITKGTEIPAKYNKDTTLGQEVAVDAIGISTGGIVFNLDY